MGLPDRPSKHDAFLALLREGWTSLHLDARRAGVTVPIHLKGEGHLVLQYGNDLPIPIPDLQVDDFGVTATLSFARSPHQTVVPWSAVYVVASDDGRGVLYHEDVPPDVSVIARGESDSDMTGGGHDDHRHGDYDGEDGAMGEGHGDSDSLSDDAQPLNIPVRPSRPRTLRAVPLVGPFDESAQVDMLADASASAPPAMPPRRRKRPQLRLVK